MRHPAVVFPTTARSPQSRGIAGSGGTSFSTGRRRAVCVVELIIWFPVLLIFLAGVIEFGLILAQLKQVALASRLGAQVAAETSSITATTVDDVKLQVDRHLSAAGLGSSCSVVLVENVTAVTETTYTSTISTCNCSSPTTTALPAGTDLALPAGSLPSGSVRVTVAVQMTNLSPNLLGVLGFSITGATVEHTTTLVHE